MAELDWEATALGSPDSWPQSLRHAVRMLLTSRHAMWIGWGPDLVFLYNDAYKPTLGVKHPAALGWPIQEVWSEIWVDIGPRIQTVMETGTATWDNGLLLILERSGYIEETYHTFSYSPLTEDDGTVSGTLCVVTEETERVIGERRLASLQELSSALATTTTELDTLAAIEHVLTSSPKDLPFTLTYLFENAGSYARLAVRTGIPLDHPASSRLIDIGAKDPVWPGEAILQGNAPILVNNLAAKFDDLPRGVWERPPRQALLVPIARQGQTQPAGFLVAGLNPFRRMDEAYSSFIQLIAGQVAAIPDITARIEAEAAERRLQHERDEVLARLELQFERMPIACLVFDRQGRIIKWNSAAETTFGYARDEAMGQKGLELLVSPAVQPQLQGLLDRVASGDMSANSVNENVTKDGRTIICEWRNTPLFDAGGEVISILSMAQDITEQKRAEEAVRESEERYRSLISQVKDFAIFSTDERGVVTTWNEGCQVVLGYSQEEFIGLDTAQLFTAEDRAQGILAAELRQARQAGTAGTERWMVARGGRRFFAVGATAAFRDSAHRVIGFSWVVRDLTPMKEFQDQLTQRGESLERLVSERTGELEETTQRLRISERMAALGTLAAGLGHDMGNLLLPMDVRLGLLIEARLPRELHEHVVGIQKCARYLQRLSSGLRLLATDPAHVESRGATDLDRWWKDVRIILKDVLPGGIRFEDHLPESESWVALGRTALTQAVYNLVQNAADAVKEHGGSRVSVTAENDPSAPWITIRVADDGPGMTEDVARRCMEPYFSTKSRGQSTGMGLSLVHALVTSAGGQIEIQSVPGQGTTISLILPRALPREQTQGASPDMAGAV